MDTGFSRSKLIFLLRARCETVSSAFSTTTLRSKDMTSGVIDPASSFDQSRTSVTIRCLGNRRSIGVVTAHER